MRESSNFIEVLKEWDISLTEHQYNQFLQYYDFLIEWNKVMNLTAITEFKEVVMKHFVDSLSLIKVQNLDDNLRIIDIGTGAGFPGIPLKIAFPNLDIVLLDSLNKRVTFLNEVIERLNLKNIKVIHGRAEDYGKDIAYREKFDICVSRAVSNLAILSEYCIPYIKVDGLFIPYKSGNILDEVNNSENALQTLGGKVEHIESFMLPNSKIERSLVIIKKNLHTPQKYPRSAGKPSKSPIL
jgi:16S rRNA (guanine527-N7)-methyltransferase